MIDDTVRENHVFFFASLQNLSALTQLRLDSVYVCTISWQSMDDLFTPCSFWDQSPFLLLLYELRPRTVIVAPGLCLIMAFRSTASVLLSVATQAFDYVVVGAGSAGCLMANRLSADPKNKVALLEAGGDDDYHWIHVPVGYLYTQGNKRTDWCFNTTSQPGLNGRTILYPRGKVLGGCSSINGMIYQRGQAADYDNWASQGNRGWGWDGVKKYFNKPLDYSSEFLADEQDESVRADYAQGGEWKVVKQRMSWPILDDMITAMNEAGVCLSNHFNNSNEEGVGYFQVNQNAGWRLSTNSAFLKPIRSRPNLTVITNAQARRVVLSSPKGRNDTNLSATGLEYYDRNGAVQSIGVRKECILTAGAVGSPHLMQVSGIGSPELLEANGVDVVHPLEGVGRNLQDHLQIRGIYRLKDGTPTMNQRANSILGRIRMGLEYIAFQTGPLSMAPSQLGAFVRSSEDAKTPDLQYHFQPLSLDKFGDPLHKFPAITLSVCNLRPTSRGTIQLDGPDSRTPPLIDPNYLSTKEDREIAAKSIKWSRKIMQQHAYSKYEPQEYLPGVHIQTDEDLAEAAGNIALSIYHPVGTCKMGPSTDAAAVVDDKLRVHGIEGLRVVDASIMPNICSGNTNSPTIMIAEKGAAMILEDALV